MENTEEKVEDEVVSTTEETTEEGIESSEKRFQEMLNLLKKLKLKNNLIFKPIWILFISVVG